MKTRKTVYTWWLDEGAEIESAMEAILNTPNVQMVDVRFAAIAGYETPDSICHPGMAVLLIVQEPA